MHRFLKELPIDDSGDLDEFDDELQSDLDTSENELNVEKRFLKHDAVYLMRMTCYNKAQVFYTPKNRPPLILKQKAVSEPSRSNSLQSRICEILSEVQQTNSRLNDVDKRLDSFEGQLKGLEQTVTSRSSF